MFGPAYFAVVSLVLGLGIPLSHQRLRRDGWPTALRWVLLVLVGGLLVGTVSHTFDALRAGWQPPPDQPVAFNIFWTSLLLLDPLGAWLLVHRTRSGLGLLVGIMIADIGVNLVAFSGNGIVSPPNPALLFQLGFGLLAFLAAPVLWRQPAAAPST